jgi:hypothetical protein
MALQLAFERALNRSRLGLNLTNSVRSIEELDKLLDLIGCNRKPRLHKLLDGFLEVFPGVDQPFLPG